ncbi:MaoC family dehydratase [Teredinibacter purpureus]|uniref:MaoC family dehydratase n=1 Tax=Teredinibacter purpureus TaxID=2731756 RepID=UPI0005F7FCF0|nr:MaoC family dehydratase [Teredinibacter purpureus]
MKEDYVKLVALLKEKSQQIQLSNGDFMKRLEPQVRELKETFNQSVSNSFANAWFSKYIASANEEPQNLISPPTPEVLTLKQRLQTKLGQEVHVGEWFTLTQATIDEFAAVTGDSQWIHIDLERAKTESPYKSTVAHGFLILSLLPHLRGLDEHAGSQYPEARLIVNCGLNSTRFLSAVKPDTEIRSRTILRALTANKRSLDIVEEVIVEAGERRREVCAVELITRIYL